MWQRGPLIGMGHVGGWHLCVFSVCIYVLVYLCIWDVERVCVRDNPGESPSLKENRCRFTYVEGPQPVMRLAAWDFSSQGLKVHI